MNDKIRPIPTPERDEIQSAVELACRLMPKQAKIARTMMDELEKAGFTEDQALKLVAYSLFHGD